MLSNKHSNNPPDKPRNNNSVTPPTSITIGTQMNSNSNIGQGLKPLNPRIAKNPFHDITLKNSRNCLLNLHKVLGETFIAEAIKNNSNSNKIRRFIELQDWPAKTFQSIGIAFVENYQ